MKSSGQIFIIGVGRSGTSLLQSMFAAHPDISYLPEISFLRRFVYLSRLEKLYRKSGKSEVKQCLEQDGHFSRTKIDAQDMIDAVLLQSGDQLDVAVYKELLVRYQTRNKNWIGDKDPKMTEFLPILKKILPEVHVLHIFRDPRDVVLSKKKADWSKDRHVWEYIFSNRIQFRMAHDFGKKLFGNRYHEIHYERLITSPEEILIDLCSDIGISFSQKMLCFGDAAQKLVSEKEMQWKKETFGPLLHENKNKWKKSLPLKEIRLTELCCHEGMQHGGYPPDDRAHLLGLKEKLWIMIGYFVIVIVSKPYILFRIFMVHRACKRI